MIKLYLTVFMLLTAVPGLLAQVRLTGTVRDTLGKPLDIANIIAVNQATQAIESFNITDEKGHYRLNLLKNTTYKLTVSYLGMRTVQEEITTGEEAMLRDFTLVPDSRVLEELSITRTIPISVRGDTLIYDADSFMNESDRKLEDVLKRLPGVEVTPDGQIKVEGKIVREIKVEGKRFFDGSTTLASKNIPANVLDKIQVLKNQEEISQLSGLRDNSDNVLIDIKLKEGKKNFWFGDIALGGGPRERYRLHPKLFYYSPKRSANVIGDLNNIADAPLTSAELGRFSVGRNTIHQRSGTGFSVETAPPSLGLRNNMAQSTRGRFAAGNLNYSPSGVWDLSGYGIYAGSAVRTQENTFKQFTQSGMTGTTELTEQTSSLRRQQNDIGLFKLSSVYSPNVRNRMDYTAFGSVGRVEQQRDFYSSVIRDVDELNIERPYQIAQALNYYYTLDEKNIFALESQHLLQSEDPFYNAVLAQSDLFPFADHLGLEKTQAYFNINQDKMLETNKFDATLDYWNVINRISNINFTFGVLASQQRFNSEIYQILDNGDRFDPRSARASVGNEVTYHFNDAYLGIRYRLKAGMFILEPAASLHAYDSRNRQSGLSASRRFFRVLPSVNVRAQLRSTEYVQLRYSMRTNFTDVQRLAEGLVMNHYNHLSLGNRDLESTRSNNFGLTYYSSINQVNRFRYALIEAGLSYGRTIEAIRNRIDPEGVMQVSSPYNSNFADESASANVGFTKAYWRLVGSVSAAYTRSEYKQLLAEQVTRNLSENQSYTVSLRSNWYGKAPTVSVGYGLNINRYSLGTTSPTFYTDRIFARADATFLKGFKLTAEYDYNNYSNEAQSLNSFGFLNAELSYLRQQSDWEFGLRGMNVLNTNKFNNDSANEFYTLTREYFIQPRYFVLSVKYHL